MVISCLACMTSLMFAANLFLLFRLRRNRKRHRQRDDDVMQMDRGTLSEQPEDGPSTALYQALGGNRSEPGKEVYASLCDVSREGIGPTYSKAADYEICGSVSPCYENVKRSGQSAGGHFQKKSM